MESVSPTMTTTLSEALAQGWERYVGVLSAVANRAAREHAVEVSLEQMQEQWADTRFTVADHAPSGSYFLTGVSELLYTLDEHAVATQNLLLSPFRAPHEDRLRRWSQLLARVGDALEEWMTVQRAWLRLWPLFQAPDLAITLPNEARKFAAVHKHWTRTLTAVKRGKRRCRRCVFGCVSGRVCGWAGHGIAAWPGWMIPVG